MPVIIEAVRGLSRLCGILAALLLIAAVLVVCHLVFVRYVLNESAIWQHEFVTFSLIGSTFLGSPYLLLVRGHVNVDLLPLYLGARARMILLVAASLLSLAFCAVIAWTGFVWWHEAWTNGWHAETVWAPPLWIPYLAMPIGMGLLALQYVVEMLALATGYATPLETPAEPHP